MNTMTFEISEELNAALQAASDARQLSPSALLREILEKTLMAETQPNDATEQWLSRWRGSLKEMPNSADDMRMAFLLQKHLH